VVGGVANSEHPMLLSASKPNQTSDVRLPPPLPPFSRPPPRCPRHPRHQHPPPAEGSGRTQTRWTDAPESRYPGSSVNNLVIRNHL